MMDSELSEHEADGGEAEESKRVTGQVFKILGQPATPVEPSVGALDNPSIGQESGDALRTPQDHRFERMRLRGLTGARDEFHLAAIVQNLSVEIMRNSQFAFRMPGCFAGNKGAA